MVLGTRGTLFGQDYEIAIAHNKATTSGTVPDGYFSQVAYAKVINSPGSDWNPWSLTQSAAFNAALAASQTKTIDVYANIQSGANAGSLGGSSTLGASTGGTMADPARLA